MFSVSRFLEICICEVQAVGILLLNTISCGDSWAILDCSAMYWDTGLLWITSTKKAWGRSNSVIASCTCMMVVFDIEHQRELNLYMKNFSCSHRAALNSSNLER